MNSAGYLSPANSVQGLRTELVWPFVWRCVGAGATFLGAVIVARLLGAEQAGWVSLGQTTASVAAAVAALGVDTAAMRGLSATLARGLRAEAHSMVNAALSVLAVSTLTVVGVGALGTHYLDVSGLFLQHKGTYVAIGLVAAAGVAIAGLFGEFLRAIRFAGSTTWFQSACAPVLLVAGLAIWGSFLNSRGTLWLYAACTWIGALGAGLWWRQKCAVPFRLPAMDKSIELLRTGIIMSMITVGTSLIGWIEMLVLSHWNHGSDIALLYAAQRVAALVALPLTIINVVAAPRFAALYAVGRFSELKRVVLKVLLGNAAIGVPMLLVLSFGSGRILGLYGPAFVRADRALDLLLLGQLVSVLSGPVMHLLMMCSRERTGLACVIAAVLVDMLCAAYGVPRWGLMGAAASSMTATVVLRVLGAVFAYRMLLAGARPRIA